MAGKQPASSHPGQQRPLDLKSRDPLHIHDPATFKIAYEDIFAEPHPGVFSLDFVWKSSFGVYNFMRLWTYRILSICGIISACCFGCQFGYQACCLIWCWTPTFKLCTLQLGIIKQIIKIFLEICVSPCIRAFSFFCWNIRVTIVRSGKGGDTDSDDGSHDVDVEAGHHPHPHPHQNQYHDEQFSPEKVPTLHIEQQGPYMNSGSIQDENDPVYMNQSEINYSD